MIHINHMGLLDQQSVSLSLEKDRAVTYISHCNIQYPIHDERM